MSTDTIKLNASVTTRIEEDQAQLFADKCKEINKNPSGFLREMITAFNEGRLRIKLQESQQLATKGLYDVD